MKKFELSSAFIIGHEKIDSDHAELVEILNEMVDGFVSGNTSYCQEKWQHFCERLEKHFSDEEKIMNDFGFVENSHDDYHHKILNHIKSLGEQCVSLEDWKACLFELRSGFLSWVLKHDLKFAEHLITIGYNEF